MAWRDQNCSPERAAERDLHERLLAGDPVAPSDLVATYLTRLKDWLQTHFRFADQHLVETAAIDSLLKVAREPQRYDPARGGLFAYLRMDARGDVRNALRAEHRRSARLTSLQAVELQPRPRNVYQERADDPAELIVKLEASDASKLAELCHDLDERERAVVQLIAEGQRRTPEFARLLELTHLPAHEQRRQVKRWKDRVLKRLRRRAKGGLGND